MTLINNNGNSKELKIDYETSNHKPTVNENNNLMLLKSKEELMMYFRKITEKIKHNISNEDRIEYEKYDIFSTSYDEDDE